ncbi:hypothetical protein BT63DRAFT_61230 [Microthyrium microscopicum]|uniref:Uncharacterized protein n=1 Tax=Microthyrium microscopicum TaxID=703497 RepID=A0A6A6U027_9PEZI|nr:hypothetical protein BT63DRAFT_61230 [Microthyrium microscopicum]
MLATPPPILSQTYLPPRPSPLSPRSTNTLNFSFNHAAQPIYFGMTDTSENAFSRPHKQSTYSQRTIKPTPFSNRNPDEQRERRRDMFLRRVEQTRDDKRWQGRSEHIMRTSYFAERHNFKLNILREAPDDVDVAMVEEDAASFELPEMMDELLVDEVERQEQMELQELLALAEQGHREDESMETESMETQTASSDYDEEEYDSIFMEFISDEASLEAPPDGPPGSQQMDMSD